MSIRLDAICIYLYLSIPYTISQSLTRPLAPVDWCRFLYYSQYVRRLGNARRKGSEKICLHREALWIMAALRPAVELFPKLEYLTWIGSGVLDCEHLPSFVSLTGSSLQVVEILAWPLHNDQKSILKTSLALLADRSPRVRKISIRFKTLSTLQLHSILSPTRPRMPSTWAHLQKFAYTRSPLDEHTFMCLAGLESLCALEIWLPDALSWTAKAMPPCSFMSLKSISLGTTVSSYITFSTLRPLPDVDSVSLQLMGAAGTERHAQLAASVRLQFSISTVRTISIT